MMEMTVLGFVVACVLSCAIGACVGFVGAFHIAGMLCEKWAGEDDGDDV